MREDRPYQALAKDGVRDSWKNGHRSTCLVAPTGAGKTHMVSSLALEFGGELLWSAHRTELVSQAFTALHGIADGASLGVIAPGHAFAPGARIQVGTVQSLLARAPALHPTMIVLDECFPAGTLVDGRPIETIRVGETVMCVDHADGMVRQGTVTRTFEKTVEKLLSLTYGATETWCTCNHPFFVKGRGYVEAKNLCDGDLLCVLQTVRMGEEMEAPPDVLARVSRSDLIGDYGAHESSARFRADEKTQPDAKQRDSRKSQLDSQENRARPEDSRRERETSDTSGASDFARHGLADASDRGDGWTRARLPKPLQDRRGERDPEDRDRGGWHVAWSAEAPSAGSEERRFLAWVRLDRVESVEPSSSGGYRVYNLEIEGAHTYFAERALVHNCHHYVSDEWAALAARFPDAKILGATATPQRGDGRPLGDMFTSLVIAAQYSELIADGFLCDAVVYQPPEALQGGLALDPVAAWQKHSRGMSGFAFCPSIKEARALAVKFNAVGIRASCIDAKTKKSERRETLQRFAGGELDVICNVDTMTEGVDVPRAGVAMLMRPFQTVGAFLQACGRVLRPHPSKEYAVIIDLTGATVLHSPPTIDRVYSLDGEGIRKGDAAANPVRNCMRCGLVYLCEETCCPSCGSAPPPKTRRPLRIFSIELQELWAGEHTKEDVKVREYLRLRGVARERGFGIDWVAREYKKNFGSKPKLFDVTPQEKRTEFHKMAALGKKLGRKPGFAASVFKEMFGHWPTGKMVNF